MSLLHNDIFEREVILDHSILLVIHLSSATNINISFSQLSSSTKFSDHWNLTLIQTCAERSFFLAAERISSSILTRIMEHPTRGEGLDGKSQRRLARIHHQLQPSYNSSLMSPSKTSLHD